MKTGQPVECAPVLKQDFHLLKKFFKVLLITRAFTGYINKGWHVDTILFMLQITENPTQTTSNSASEAQIQRQFWLQVRLNLAALLILPESQLLPISYTLPSLLLILWSSSMCLPPVGTSTMASQLTSSYLIIQEKKKTSTVKYKCLVQDFFGPG